jgi:uncharacterized Tic20 family protein
LNPPGAAFPLTPYEEKQWSVLTHVLGIFFGIIPAIIFYLLYKDRGPFVRAHTVTEWNFQLTVIIFSALGFVLAFASFFTGFFTTSTGSGPPAFVWLFFVGYFLILAIRLTAMIFGIIAAIAAYRGQFYRYPLAIRFVKA